MCLILLKTLSWLLVWLLDRECRFISLNLKEDLKKTRKLLKRTRRSRREIERMPKVLTALSVALAPLRDRTRGKDPRKIDSRIRDYDLLP